MNLSTFKMSGRHFGYCKGRCKMFFLYVIEEYKPTLYLCLGGGGRGQRVKQ